MEQELIIPKATRDYIDETLFILYKKIDKIIEKFEKQIQIIKPEIEKINNKVENTEKISLEFISAINRLSAALEEYNSLMKIQTNQNQVK